jgi:hypothetical protein
MRVMRMLVVMGAIFLFLAYVLVAGVEMTGYGRIGWGLVIGVLVNVEFDVWLRARRYERALRSIYNGCPEVRPGFDGDVCPAFARRIAGEALGVEPGAAGPSASAGR